MTSEDIEMYPNFHKWLRDFCHSVRHRRPKVYAAYRRQVLFALAPGNFSQDIECLRWGWPPVIVPDKNLSKCEIIDASNVPVQRWYGFTVPNRFRNKILVASDLAIMAGNPEVDLVLEATLLHELIHWYRLMEGKTLEGPAEEVQSEAFEMEAYGKPIRRTWNGCLDNFDGKPRGKR
jgi:Metallopeptidase toxin 3